MLFEKFYFMNQMQNDKLLSFSWSMGLTLRKLATTIWYEFITIKVLLQSFMQTVLY